MLWVVIVDAGLAVSIQLFADSFFFLCICFLQPEMACNVQHYPQGAYLRRAEAEQCQVQSSMLLPIFTEPPTTRNNNTKRPSTVAVLEVVQTSEDMQFMVMAQLISHVLEVCWWWLHLQNSFGWVVYIHCFTQ